MHSQHTHRYTLFAKVKIHKKQTDHFKSQKKNLQKKPLVNLNKFLDIPPSYEHFSYVLAR